jgi:hypothetical protein
MHDAGYSFGEAFQTQRLVETNSAERKYRSLVSMAGPSSTFLQSPYIMHPVSIDGCLQTAGVAIWKGNPSSIDTVLVPSMIDECVIHAQSGISKSGIGISSAEIGRAGRIDDPTSYKSHTTVFDSESQRILFEMKGFRQTALNTRKNRHESHSYTQIHWRPDISFIEQQSFQGYAASLFPASEHHISSGYRISHEIVRLVLHKHPTLRVVELNLTGSSSSLWLDEIQQNRMPGQKFQFALDTTQALLTAQEAYTNVGDIEFVLLESLGKAAALDVEDAVDLFILQIPNSLTPNLAILFKDAQQQLSEVGTILVLSHFIQAPSPVKDNLAYPSEYHSFGDKITGDLLSANLRPRFSNVLDSTELYTSGSPRLSFASNDPLPVAPGRPSILIAHMSDNDKSHQKIIHELATYGWGVEHLYPPFDKVPSGSTIFVIESSSSPLLTNISSEDWQALQILFSKEHHILWVTEGSQMEIANPDCSLIQGLLRSVRMEDTSIDLVTLDVECLNNASTVFCMDQVLQKRYFSKSPQHNEAEYVERKGILYVSRIISDSLLNEAEKSSTYGSKPFLAPLHGQKTCVRLISDQPGSLDSLHWAEVATEEIALPEGFAEVDIHAVSLNFKASSSPTLNVTRN